MSDKIRLEQPRNFRKTDSCFNCKYFGFPDYDRKGLRSLGHCDRLIDNFANNTIIFAPKETICDGWEKSREYVRKKSDL